MVHKSWSALQEGAQNVAVIGEPEEAKQETENAATVTVEDLPVDRAG